MPWSSKKVDILIDASGVNSNLIQQKSFKKGVKKSQ